jgi:hypothetical protein
LGSGHNQTKKKVFLYFWQNFFALLVNTFKLGINGKRDTSNFEKSSKMVKSWHKMTKRRHLFQLAFIPFLIGTYISGSITPKLKIWVLRSESLQYTNMCTEYL